MCRWGKYGEEWWEKMGVEGERSNTEREWWIEYIASYMRTKEIEKCALFFGLDTSATPSSPSSMSAHVQRRRELIRAHPRPPTALRPHPEGLCCPKTCRNSAVVKTSTRCAPECIWGRKSSKAEPIRGLSACMRGSVTPECAPEHIRGRSSRREAKPRQKKEEKKRKEREQAPEAVLGLTSTTLKSCCGGMRQEVRSDRIDRYPAIAGTFGDLGDQRKSSATSFLNESRLV
ncbi:hypothetical protein BDZ89DRAFT_1042389 [Hymenopellis radicata]|nr:hypothetical protein BDZ89DRAFT_1042389 [Hymenopellis radicata]